jgi:hypothetical protein
LTALSHTVVSSHGSHADLLFALRRRTTAFGRCWKPSAPGP